MLYAGLENENECYCGTEDHDQYFSLASKPDSQCSRHCAGEYLISIYNSMYYLILYLNCQIIYATFSDKTMKYNNFLLP